MKGSIYKPIALQTHTEAASIVPVSKDQSLRDSIVEYGIQLQGTPYVTAESGEEGFDCSGFVYFVYQILISRYPVVLRNMSILDRKFHSLMSKKEIYYCF